jgi:hypothetical protein
MPRIVRDIAATATEEGKSRDKSSTNIMPDLKDTFKKSDSKIDQTNGSRTIDAILGLQSPDSDNRKEHIEPVYAWEGGGEEEEVEESPDSVGSLGTISSCADEADSDVGSISLSSDSGSEHGSRESTRHSDGDRISERNDVDDNGFSPVSWHDSEHIVRIEPAQESLTTPENENDDKSDDAVSYNFQPSWHDSTYVVRAESREEAQGVAGVPGEIPEGQERIGNLLDFSDMEENPPPAMTKDDAYAKRRDAAIDEILGLG